VAQSLTKILPRVLDVLTYVGNDCKWLGSISILYVGTSDLSDCMFPEDLIDRRGRTQKAPKLKKSGGKIRNHQLNSHSRSACTAHPFYPFAAIAY
jgi:hypothetical protein